MEETGKRAIEAINEGIELLQKMVNGGKSGKKEIKEVLSSLEKAVREAGPNFGFAMKQAEEALDKNLNAAKTELEAHGLAMIRSLGMTAIAEQISPEEKNRLISQFISDTPQKKLEKK